MEYKSLKLKMNKNIIILFALKKEANSLLYQSGLKFEKLSGNEFFCKYNDYKISIYIIGIGKKAKKTYDRININKDCLIIKAGTCAILDNNIPLLTPIIPKYIGNIYQKINLDFLLLDEKLHSKIKSIIIDKGLITLDKPLINKKKADEFYNNNYAACDMEVFYLIEKYKGLPFIPILVGTDRGNKNSIILFLKNISKASEIIKDQIIRIIK